MRRIEEILGVPLFERSKSKIALNKAGKVAVQYARKVLEADAELVEQVAAFDRSQRTLVLGACAALPIQFLLPVLQEWYSNVAITTEITDDESLLAGLQNRSYQLAILHSLPG